MKHIRSGSASGWQERLGNQLSSSTQGASAINDVAVTDSDSGRRRGKDDGHQTVVVGSMDRTRPSESGNEKLRSWWERVFGRKKQGIENHV